MFGYRRHWQPFLFSAMRIYVIALVAFAAVLLGWHLPIHASRTVRILLEVVVAFLVYQGVRAAVRMRKARMQLYSAQQYIALAMALQGFILLLRR